MESNKPLEEKTIIEKYTDSEGKFKMGYAILDLDKTNKNQEERIRGLEEAMQFFSEWYNKTQRVDILVPEHLANNNSGTPIILSPGSTSIMD